LAKPVLETHFVVRENSLHRRPALGDDSRIAVIERDSEPVDPSPRACEATIAKISPQQVGIGLCREVRERVLGTPATRAADAPGREAGP
jgi:hypothetical protein